MSGILSHPLSASFPTCSSQGTSDLFYFLYLISKPPCPAAAAPALRFVLFVPFYRLFKKSPLCLSPSCLCSFVPFSCSRCCTTGLLWNSLLPWGLVAILGDKLWQEEQESWASLPAWPSPHSSASALYWKTWLFSQNYHYHLLEKYFTFSEWRLPEPIAFCADGRIQTRDSMGIFSSVAVNILFSGRWILDSHTAKINTVLKEISLWLISSTENEYGSVFRCLNWKFFM